MTHQQKVDVRDQFIAVLEQGNAHSKALAKEIRARNFHVEYSNLPDNVLGRFVGGQNKVRVSARLVAEGNADKIASTIVHESQHLVDDVAGKLSGFSRRRGEFRAHAGELLFQFSFRRSDLYELNGDTQHYRVGQNRLYRGKTRPGT